MKKGLEKNRTNSTNSANSTNNKSSKNNRNIDNIDNNKNVFILNIKGCVTMCMQTCSYRRA